MRVAAVEDDAAQAMLIQQVLEESGLICRVFCTGSEFMRSLRDQTFDLVILDWQLPDISGCEIVNWLRLRSGSLPPIMFLTGRGEETDIVAGLGAGADDYLIKPLRPAEFVARVRALLRRSYDDFSHDEQLIRLGSYVVDIDSCQVLLNGRPVELLPRERDLAIYLFRNAGRLLSRDVIERAVWGSSLDASTRTLASHLSRLRTKLALRPEHGVRLTSVYSHGYRLEAAVAAHDT